MNAQKSSGCLGSCFSIFGSLTGLGILLAVAALVLYLVLWAAGGILIISDAKGKTDAVAVLSGGGAERIQAAAQVYQEVEPLYFILTDPGVIIPDTGSTVTFSNRLEAIESGVPIGAIIETEEHPNSTVGEANELRRYLETHHISSVTVVTDPYHSLRTRMIFRDAFEGSEVKVRVRPAPSHWYRSTTWFLSARGWEATLAEYAKIAAYLAGVRDE